MRSFTPNYVKTRTNESPLTTIYLANSPFGRGTNNGFKPFANTAVLFNILPLPAVIHDEKNE